MDVQTQNQANDERLLTLKQFVAEFPEYTVPQIRWHVHNAERNGLALSGAIVRIKASGGSRGRIRLHVGRYRAWQLAAWL